MGIYCSSCIPFVECGGEGVMKPNNVSSVSTNQAKWSNTQGKNFIINAVPVKNEVRQSVQWRNKVKENQ